MDEMRAAGLRDSGIPAIACRLRLSRIHVRESDNPRFKLLNRKVSPRDFPDCSNNLALEPFDRRHSYVAGLDGLRAVAVTTVFFSHAFSNVIANPVGVDMFFALSGFLITRGLARKLENNGRIDLLFFYSRRVLRLMPALVLMVLTVLTVALFLEIFLGDHQLRQHLMASCITLTYLMNWSRASHHGPPGWLGHTWSLSIEEQFYLLWPLALIATYRWGGAKRVIRCAAVFALLSVLLRICLYHTGATEDRIYNGFDTRADGLLIGCTLALARPFTLSAWAGRLWLVPVLAIVCVFLFVRWLNLETLSSTIIAGACAWLILPLWSQTSPRLAKALEFGPVRYVGRISYGLYLWHWPVLKILWEFHFARNGLATAALAGAITLLSAAASFHFVEQPILRRKERIGRRLIRLLKPSPAELVRLADTASVDRRHFRPSFLRMPKAVPRT
jgi:peptidoglycan/LPS O-acetylase OafA/YrhL